MIPQQITSSGPAPSRRVRTNKKRPPVFPKRLYDMLENAERDGYSHIISWMPDGKSFKIHADGSQDEEDEKAIVEILKRTFNQTRFKSFLRQLQLYGFERTYKGPRRGECKHEMFVRGRRDLLHKKSIEDFQRKANDTSNKSPKSVRSVFQYSASPLEVTSMPQNDSIDTTRIMPLCQPLARVVSGCDKATGCNYFETSAIPTKLTNLVLPDSDKSVSKVSEDEEDEDIFSMSTNQPRRQSVIPFHKGENVPYWTGLELQILKYAL